MMLFSMRYILSGTDKKSQKFFSTLVQEVMLIAGGNTEVSYTSPSTVSKSLNIVMPDGDTCSETLPELPKSLEGFGMASRKNRYIYLCGGIERKSDSGKDTSMQRFLFL